MKTTDLIPMILYLLKDGDKYGYEIVQSLEEKSNGQIEIKQPTLYTILKKLEKSKFITSYWQDSDIGGKRHYYKITPNGMFQLDTYPPLEQIIADAINEDKDVLDTAISSPELNNSLNEENDNIVFNELENENISNIDENANYSFNPENTDETDTPQNSEEYPSSNNYLRENNDEFDLNIEDNDSLSIDENSENDYYGKNTISSVNDEHLQQPIENTYNDIKDFSSANTISQEDVIASINKIANQTDNSSSQNQEESLADEDITNENQLNNQPENDYPSPTLNENLNMEDEKLETKHLNDENLNEIITQENSSNENDSQSQTTINKSESTPNFNEIDDSTLDKKTNFEINKENIQIQSQDSEKDFAGNKSVATFIDNTTNIPNPIQHSPTLEDNLPITKEIIKYDVDSVNYTEYVDFQTDENHIRTKKIEKNILFKNISGFVMLLLTFVMLHLMSKNVYTTFYGCFSLIILAVYFFYMLGIIHNRVHIHLWYLNNKFKFKYKKQIIVRTIIFIVLFAILLTLNLTKVITDYSLFSSKNFGNFLAPVIILLNIYIDYLLCYLFYNNLK